MGPRHLFAAGDRWLVPIVLMGATAWLRLANLGYSDYQGDEGKALTILSQGKSLLGFLLHQRKGPLQFLVTYALSWYDPSFANEFLFRLPFAIAGILSVWFFYCLIRLYLEERVALYAGFLFAVNGIIVGLSRIVQYQAFVMLGTVLCLYWLTLAVNAGRYRITGLYLALFAALVSCLAHFDGFFVIPPAILLLNRWMRRNTSNRLRRHILFSVTIFVIPNLLFYLSLYFNLASETVGYWQARLVGKRSKTTKLFTLYNGWPATYIYLLFGAIGIAHQCKKVGGALYWRRRGDAVSKAVVPVGTVAQKESILPLLVLWIVPPYLWMEFVMSQPRTHIYVYLLPSFVFVALGLRVLDRWMEGLIDPDRQVRHETEASFSARRLIVQTPSLVVLLLLFGMTNAIFVDHRPEYPWENETLLGINFTGKKMAGMMGFPYYRRWAEVATFLDEAAGPGPQLYLTNEKGLVGFYLPTRFTRATPDSDGNKVYILQVERPQSWRGLRIDPGALSENGKILQIFRDEDGRPLVTIYEIEASELKGSPELSVRR